MRMIGRIALGGAAAAVAVAASAPLSGASRALAPCKGTTLTGSFRAIPGSAGAGNIVYRLRLANKSAATCFVTGIPSLTLLDQAGRKLPTKGTFAGRPGSLTAVMVPLANGKTATLTARFSPDIPGQGEASMGQCEPTAYKLRVAPSGGSSVVVPIAPATPVCEHGSLQLTVFTAA